MTAIFHALSVVQIVDWIVHMLHAHGTTNLNADVASSHHGIVETRHWIIHIRWKG